MQMGKTVYESLKQFIRTASNVDRKTGRSDHFENLKANAF